ncbi:hypothetical protein ACFQY4_33090 [Catellatospora bangladeshensis]|uniref:hypothetical protein n=1 Tax=Catellatospora bangladeshensis TaxID=310355 RepID=UPI00361535EA
MLDGEVGDGVGCRLPAALLALLDLLAQDGPVLVCVDDADLLDEPSREALAFAARRLGDAAPSAARLGDGSLTMPRPEARTAPDTGGGGAVVLLAMRDDDELPPPGLPVLLLSPLDETACAAVIDDVAPVAVAEGVRLRLAAAAAGNPQAAAELVAALDDDQLRGIRPLPDPLPPSPGLRRAHLRRVLALPEQTRRLLLIAAAEADMDANLLVRAADAAGIEVAALEPAERAGLLRVSVAGVEFRHPLVPAAIYHAAPLAGRRAAHALLAGCSTPVGIPCAGPGTGRRPGSPPTTSWPRSWRWRLPQRAGGAATRWPRRRTSGPPS